ncbi:MAG: hypothetical protein ABR564_03575 [Candidatus Dormibacteria bacterium]
MPSVGDEIGTDTDRDTGTPPVVGEVSPMVGFGKAVKMTMAGGHGWHAAVAAGATLLMGSVGVVAINHQGEAATAAPVVHRTAIPVTAVAPVILPDEVTPGPLPPPGTTSVPVAPVAPRVLPRTPALKPAPSKAPARTAAPVSHTNYLTSDDGTLNTGVGTYSDCTGNSPLASDQAAILTCVTGRLYFVGHNYGVFTPLIHMNTGDGITYWDARSVPHHYRVVAVVPAWQRANGPPPPSQSNVTAQFQTCATPDGEVDRILNAVSDPTDTSPTVLSPVIAAAAPVVNTVTTTTSTTTTTWSGLLGKLLGRR